MDDIQHALQRIEVEPVGDVVVKLTLTESNHQASLAARA